MGKRARITSKNDSVDGKINISGKRKALLAVFCLVFAVPLLYSNELMDTGAMHRLGFAYIIVLLLVLILTAKPSNPTFNLPHVTIFFSFALPAFLYITSVHKSSIEMYGVDLYQTTALFIFAFTVTVFIKDFGVQLIIKTAAYSITTIATAVSILGLMQAFGYNILQLPKVSVPGSTFAGSNFAAEYIVAAIPWSVILLLEDKSPRFRYLLYGIITLLISYLLLLRSRAGYLAYAAALIVLLFYVLILKPHPVSLIPKRKLFATAILIIAISTLIGFLQPEHLYRKSFFGTIQNISTESDMSKARLHFWDASIQMFKSDPLTGLGSGQWAANYYKYYGHEITDSNKYFIESVNPHNDYLEILSENGALTFLLFVSFNLFILYKLFQAGRKDIRYILIGVSVLSTCIIAFFAFPKDRIATMILFYFGAGIVWSLPSANAFQITQRFFKILLVPLLIFCVSYMVYVTGRNANEKLYKQAMAFKFNSQYNEMLGILNGINRNIYAVDGFTIPLSYYMGVGHFELQDYRKALAYFDEAFKLNHYNPLIVNNLASTHYMLNNLIEAEKYYTLSKSVFPNYFEPQINLLALYANSHKDRLAKQLLQEIYPKNPENLTLKQIKEYYFEKL
ncbi:MAG: O-antigen ligase family protein [Ignavibacteriales bacterium]|nr:O-antigen ligase family protein [Ignavibacteriales bacterium]